MDTPNDVARLMAAIARMQDVFDDIKPEIFGRGYPKNELQSVLSGWAVFNSLSELLLEQISVRHGMGRH
jgi:hypothetical protein